MTTLRKIIHGGYEPIISQLRNSYATILNLYTLMGEKLLDIYPRSFHFVQANTFEKKEARSLIMRKIALLKDMKYITDGDISEKAKLSSQVYSFELQIGEIFEDGFLNTLDEPTLFLVISALVYEPRKGFRRPPLNRKIKRLRNDLNIFIRAIHRKERKFRIYPASKIFYFHLSDAAQAWYEGAEFYKLANYSTCDEGELVRYFRMAIQVLKEIHSSDTIAPSLKEATSRCIKKVNRDVVNAENQLRQAL